MPKYAAIVVVTVPEADHVTMQDYLNNSLLPSPRDLEWGLYDESEVPAEEQTPSVKEPTEEEIHGAKALAAISYATENLTPAKAGEFLKLWRDGSYDIIRDKYENVPEDLL